jgi:hypothetical protein
VHSHALDLLTDALGATVIATYPNAGPRFPTRAGAESMREFLTLFPAVSRTCSVTVDGSATERPSGAHRGLPPDNDDALSARLAAAHSLTSRSGRVVICLHEPSPFGPV